MSHAPLSQAPHVRTPFPRALIRFAATLTAIAALTTGIPAGAAEPGGAVLQFGLYGKEGEAWWAWQTMKRRKPELVNGLTADVVALGAGNQGGVALRARTAAGTDGNALCRRIVGAGFGCLVIEQAPAAAPAPRSAETTITTVKPTIKPSPAPQPAPAPALAEVPPAPQAVVVPVAMAAPKAPEAPATITTAVLPPSAPPPAPITVAMAAPPPPPPPAPPSQSVAPAPAPAAPAQATPAGGLRFAPFAPPPAAPAKPAGAATHAGMPGHDGVFLYNDDEARVLREIEGRARVRGRLGAIIPDTKIDISPAVLKRENWNLCAVTFDDGPHRTVTRQILEILNQEKIVATYFPVGRVAAHYPDIIKEWVAAGHEIGNHSQTHADLRPLPAEAQRFEIAEANRILRTMGANPVLFRPPYGRYTLDLLAIAREEKMAPVLWNVDTRDWQMRDPDKIVQHVKTAAGTGSVLLMHSTYPSTAAALPRVISDLRSKGCQFVTLSEWIERMRNLAAPMMVNAAEPVVSAGAPLGGAPH
ncbi:MAG TPA: polysaccharide deacetylase family protein [Azospirillum sp.]|nr:polysaccharide deacetylase family protein [Azospirillum sp.]